MMLMAASTARSARAARLRGRSWGWWDAGVSDRRVAPGEDTEPGEAPVVWEKIKGRPTKISLRWRHSLRWAFDRNDGDDGAGSRVSEGSAYHQALKDWHMSTMRSK